MTRPDLPELLEVNEEEASLGFRRLIVESDVEPDELCVAYVVNDSDIVRKASLCEKIGYKHLRWGIMRNPKRPGLIYPPESSPPKWHPLGATFYSEPAEAIQSSEFEPDEPLGAIEPRKFEGEEYDPSKHGE